MLARALPLPGALLDAPLAENPCCGLADLDIAAPLRPGTLTLVDHPAGPAADVVFAWMADVAVTGRLVLVADGSNFMDIYRLSAAARRRAAARMPDAPRATLTAQEELVLERVRLARGFTAHQLQSIVEDGLAEQARAAEGEVGLVAAPGLLDMYLDDDLSREEARALAVRALSSLRRLAARLRVPALVSNTVLSPAGAHPLRVLLEESVDEQVLLRPAPGGGMGIRLPRRGAAFLAPGPGRTRLEDFLDHADRATPIPRPAPKAPGEWTSSGYRMMGKFGEAYRRSAWVAHEAREAS